MRKILSQTWPYYKEKLTPWKMDMHGYCVLGKKLAFSMAISKSTPITQFWIALGVWLEIWFRFLKSKKLYFLKLSLIIVGLVLNHFLKYQSILCYYIMQTWSLYCYELGYILWRYVWKKLCNAYIIELKSYFCIHIIYRQ